MTRNTSGCPQASCTRAAQVCDLLQEPHLRGRALHPLSLFTTASLCRDMLTSLAAAARVCSQAHNHN